MLETNRARFYLDTDQGEDDKSGSGGASNFKYIEKRMKDPIFRRYKGFTDNDDEFILAVKTMLQQGLMAKKTAKNIKAELEKEADPLQMLGILRKHVRNVSVEETTYGKTAIKREVILSGYLLK